MFFWRRISTFIVVIISVLPSAHGNEAATFQEFSQQIMGSTCSYQLNMKGTKKLLALTVERADSGFYSGRFTLDSGNSVESYPLAFKLNDDGVYIKDFPSPLSGERVNFTDPQKIFAFGLRSGEKWESRSAYQERSRLMGITAGNQNYHFRFSGKHKMSTSNGEMDVYRVDAEFTVSMLQYNYVYPGSIQLYFGSGPCFLKGWKYKNRSVRYERSELTLIEESQGDSDTSQLGQEAKSVVEWYASKSTPNFYIRLASERSAENDPVYRLWLIVDDELSGSSVRSRKDFVEVDCRESSINLLKSISYSAPDGNGSIVTQDDNSDIGYVVPGTNGELIHSLVCSDR